MDFKNAWERIKAETNITTFSELGEVVGKTQSNISVRKKRGDFPIEWAYLVGEKYNLSTKWILTGHGIKKTDQVPAEKINDFFEEIIRLQEWLSEISRTEPERRAWFKMELLDKFPLFKEWLENKKDKQEYLEKQKVA